MPAFSPKAALPVGGPRASLGIALRSRLILPAMSSAKKGAPQYFLDGPYFLDRDDLDTHRGCPLALTATNMLSKINLIDCAAFFAWQFTDELTHRLRFLLDSNYIMSFAYRIQPQLLSARRCAALAPKPSIRDRD